MKNKAKTAQAKGKTPAKAVVKTDAKKQPAAKPQAAKAALTKDSKKAEPNTFYGSVFLYRLFCILGTGWIKHALVRGRQELLVKFN